MLEDVCRYFGEFFFSNIMSQIYLHGNEMYMRHIQLLATKIYFGENILYILTYILHIYFFHVRTL